MKVKKFFANTNHEALMKVRTELGPDAIILHQRKTKPKGLFGFLKKPIIEVVAAKEEDNLKQMNFNVQSKPKKKEEEKIPDNNANTSQKISNISDVRKFEEKKNTIESDKVIFKEINEIKQILGTVINKMKYDDLSSEDMIEEKIQNQKLYRLLKQQELDEAIIEELIMRCGILDEKKYNSNNISLKDIAKKHLTDMISKYTKDAKLGSESKVVFFVGPTGVGKTTTIAKLAAHYSLNEGKTIGLISADTYRIAAVEQLKVYSDILNISLEVIYEPSEIIQAVSKFDDKDIIMIDTAGRNHKNTKQMMELENLLNQLNKKEVYLVLSSTSRKNDLDKIIQSYHFLKDYKLIFTKIDEATNFGIIVNTLFKVNKPLSYLTTGQSVPDDIEKTKAERVARLIMEEE